MTPTKQLLLPLLPPTPPKDDLWTRSAFWASMSLVAYQTCIFIWYVGWMLLHPKR